jgi:integrase
MADLALSTGLRQANVFRLEWEQVDMKRKLLWIHADQAKGGAVLRVKLQPIALEVLEARRGKHPRRVFQGEDVSLTLSKILQTEPEFNALPADTPANVHRLLRRCLQKDPKRRLHDIADARIELLVGRADRRGRLRQLRAHGLGWTDEPVAAEHGVARHARRCGTGEREQTELRHGQSPGQVSPLTHTKSPHV